eukprot:CAMPEP_0197679422 /NCGR_PEP_ID=MMETSP1338-20131121/91664_1 /TAXON_ID=43686 ORGANISM="Pelagodinium beii, Strain RCC1491" /NCGR_SAMPLE_ID=MMETSP1338 /ASSEMBLY_ACC=CAM_ASM_000754 /LENGTH=122 /DNA_ID=CAMNT_0043260477 /DNA_START=92 /DNA_END=457 /DNA_ORIENTATION=-
MAIIRSSEEGGLWVPITGVNFYYRFISCAGEGKDPLLWGLKEKGWNFEEPRSQDQDGGEEDEEPESPENANSTAIEGSHSEKSNETASHATKASAEEAAAENALDDAKHDAEHQDRKGSSSE